MSEAAVDEALLAAVDGLGWTTDGGGICNAQSHTTATVATLQTAHNYEQTRQTFQK